MVENVKELEKNMEIKVKSFRLNKRSVDQNSFESASLDIYRFLLSSQRSINEKVCAFENANKYNQNNKSETIKVRNQKIMHDFEMQTKYVTPQLVMNNHPPTAILAQEASKLPNIDFTSFQLKAVDTVSLEPSFLSNTASTIADAQPLVSSDNKIVLPSVSHPLQNVDSKPSKNSSLPMMQAVMNGIEWLVDWEQQLSALLQLNVTDNTKRSAMISVLNQLESINEVENSDEMDSGAQCVNEQVVVEQLEEILSQALSQSSRHFVFAFMCLARVVIAAVQQSPSEKSILTFSSVVLQIFGSMRALMQTEAAKILDNMLNMHSALCMPSFFGKVGDSAVFSEKSFRLLTFKAVLVGRSGKISSPLHPQEGWTWLQHAVKQLFCCCTALSDSQSCFKIDASLVTHICRCLRIFLRFTGSTMWLATQELFSDMLKNIKTVLSQAPVAVQKEEEVVKLTSFLHEAVARGAIFQRSSIGFSELVSRTAELERNLNATRDEVAAVDRNKSSPLFESIRHFQIDRLRAVFNKLSATPESQAIAVASLLEKLVVSSKHSPELLRYTSFKIAHIILTDCQMEFFNETDEGHPTKLARVTCGLCSSVADLTPVLRAQFNFHCLLTIPRGAHSGLQGDSFLEDMRFVRKKSNVGLGDWEDKSQWLARMSKILCTFAVIVTQPEQTPFSLEDGWRWLVVMIESNLELRSLPFYVASALEVFLRVTAPSLLAKFGSSFMQLMYVVQSRLLPLMSEDMPRRQCLEEFLSRFLASGGADFMSLFQLKLE